MSRNDLRRPGLSTIEALHRLTSGGLSRRHLVQRALALAAALPAARSLTASGAAAAPARQADPATLTIALNGSPSDLDPHSAYDYRSAIVGRGPYEQLSPSTAPPPTGTSA